MIDVTEEFRKWTELSHVDVLNLARKQAHTINRLSTQLDHERSAKPPSASAETKRLRNVVVRIEGERDAAQASVSEAMRTIAELREQLAAAEELLEAEPEEPEAESDGDEPEDE